jgi:hypothetical protein
MMLSGRDASAANVRAWTDVAAWELASPTISGFGVSVGPAIFSDGEALLNVGVVAEPAALTSSIGGRICAR